MIESTNPFEVVTITAGSAILLYLWLGFFFHLRSSKRPVMKERDFQKSKVYKWERSELRSLVNKRLTRVQTFRFYHSVCDKIGLSKEKRPKLTTHKRGANYWHTRNRINLPPYWGWNRLFVIHELAHHLADTKYGWDISAHGPLFMKEFIYLLTRATRMGDKRLVESLTKARIKFELYQENSDVKA